MHVHLCRVGVSISEAPLRARDDAIERVDAQMLPLATASQGGAGSLELAGGKTLANRFCDAPEHLGLHSAASASTHAPHRFKE